MAKGGLMSCADRTFAAPAPAGVPAENRRKAGRSAARRLLWPAGPLLAALCLQGFAVPAGGQNWIDLRIAGPFICRADFRLAEIEGLFPELAQLQDELVAALGIRPARETVELYLFHQPSSYRSYLARRFPQIPYRRALYVKGRGPGMVFACYGKQFDVDLRHECTHALLHAALPMVPLWLDEGLAVYFEPPPPQRAFDSPHLSSVRWAARFGYVPRLGTLEQKNDISQMGSSEYRSAWAWVHFMLHGPREAHEELSAFLIDIQKATPPGLLSDRLQNRLPDLSRRFTKHFTGWKK
jgi:hypothetical protein